MFEDLLTISKSKISTCWFLKGTVYGALINIESLTMEHLRKNIDGEVVNETEKFMKLKEVLELCSLCRAQLYNMMEKGLFPPNHRISSGRVVWLKSDISIWRSLTLEAFELKYASKLLQERAA